MAKTNNSLHDLLGQQSDTIVTGWLKTQKDGLKGGQINEGELTAQSKKFFSAFQQGVLSGDRTSITGPDWATARKS